MIASTLADYQHFIVKMLIELHEFSLSNFSCFDYYKLEGDLSYLVTQHSVFVTGEVSLCLLQHQTHLISFYYPSIRQNSQPLDHLVNY